MPNQQEVEFWLNMLTEVGELMYNPLSVKQRVTCRDTLEKMSDEEFIVWKGRQRRSGFVQDLYERLKRKGQTYAQINQRANLPSFRNPDGTRVRPNRNGEGRIGGLQE